MAQSGLVIQPCGFYTACEQMWTTILIMQAWRDDKKQPNKPDQCTYEMDIECINNNNIEKTVSIYLSPAIHF